MKKPQKAVNINCLKVFMKRLNRSMDDLLGYVMEYTKKWANIRL